jgi:dTDP-4-dehydrorhamnose 3,5-epimerase
MKVIDTEIPGVLILEPQLHGDGRGFFLELFQSARYAASGIERPFLQDNISRSSRGVLRGLHLQNPKCQGKVITVLSGAILDVAVDMRVGSPTFGRHTKVVLSDENRRQVWVPRGFAHGFLVLSETADMFYKCDEIYYPEHEIVVRWDDPELAIDWPCGAPVLSKRDLQGRTIAELLDGLPRHGFV